MTSSPQPSDAPRGPRLRIVSVNDVYSLANLPRLATLIRHYAATDPADAFLAVLAGDFLAPSMLSSLDRGRGMVECLNAAGVGVVIFGNHEDDVPVGDLHRRIQEFRGDWISTNMRELDARLVPAKVVRVGKPGGRAVRVGLVGVVMTDPTVYRRAPFGGSPLEPANASVLREAARLRSEEGCDFVIPITHQPLAQDRALIREARAALGAPFRLIVGGHEHDVHVEQDDGTWLVKAGSEAVKAAVIEIEWPSVSPPERAAGERSSNADAPTVSVRLEPVATYDEDAPLRAIVDRHMKRVVELESAILLPLAHGERLSSVGSRARQTSMGTLVTSRVRDELGADACLVNGGGIRASREYTEHLAFGDIKAELPFENEMVLVAMPGRVFAGAVKSSRARAPVEHGGFLHVDDGVSVDLETNTVTAVAGAPLDPDRDYTVATVRSFFTGMDHIEPLVLFANAHPERIPPPTSGRELKEVLVEALAVDLWRRLGGFEALDTDRDGRVTEADVALGLSRLLGTPASPLTVTLVMNAVDKNHDHEISRDEADLVRRRSPAADARP